MGGGSVSNKKRLLIVFGIFAFVFLLLMGQLFSVMIIRGPELEEQAISQQTRDTSLTAFRGSIMDSLGVVLAQSGTAYKILIWPQAIDSDDRERVATELASVLELDYATVLAKVNDIKKQEIVLKRHVERDVVDRITALKLGNGVATAMDSKRYYPEGSLFSQLIGFTTIDGVGQDGLEQKYDKYLAGEDGRMINETDRNSNQLAYGVQEIIEPIDGCDIVLTTNSVVESSLEKALKTALEVNKAQTAQGVIMNCKTGEIVAMSTQPDYDPNSPPRDDMKTLAALTRNRIVADAYEPGSTFKIITLSAALDSGAVDESFTVDCPGYYVVNGERIKCWKSGGHGHQTLVEAVENSCNPAFMRMALSMGVETFYDYIYSFGFGVSTGSGISGESGGIVTHQKYIKENTLARIGFGQSIAMTPLQLANAVCAAVNGGKLMQPYLVERIINEDGEVIRRSEPTVIRSVISEQTSKRVREILESVVENGSGRNAQIPGFRVGGKTGTAQKYDENGSVAQGKLIASFIGFAPADDPEYVCLILVDEPKVGTIFGSTVAAPFVKQVLEETLRYYGFLPTESAETVKLPDVCGLTVPEAKAALKELGIEAEYQQEDIVTAQVPLAGETVLKGSGVLLYTELTDEVIQTEPEKDDLVEVPDVIGKTRLSVYDMMKAAGLVPVIDPYDQKGKAVRQSPVAGSMVERGSEVLVEFSDVAIGGDDG